MIRISTRPEYRAIAVLTLAFALVTRALPGVRLRPAGEAAFRPPASRGEGAEGTAFVHLCAGFFVSSLVNYPGETPARNTTLSWFPPDERTP